jgi:hypothetical protein
MTSKGGRINSQIPVSEFADFRIRRQNKDKGQLLTELKGS